MQHAVPYIVSAPVQADRTGDSLVELNAQISEFLTTKGVTQEELERTVANDINEPAGIVRDLGRGAERDDEHRHARPARQLLRDAGAPNIARRRPPSLDKAARSLLDPKGFTWIVVGDAAKVRPQLEKLGMPIEVVEAPLDQAIPTFTGDMAHLAAGASFALAVDVDVHIGLGDEIGPAVDVVADEVVHDRAATNELGRAGRKVADGADMLFELRGDRALDRPMAAVVDPRRDLVDDGPVRWRRTRR